MTAPAHVPERQRTTGRPRGNVLPSPARPRCAELGHHGQVPARLTVVRRRVPSERVASLFGQAAGFVFDIVHGRAGQALDRRGYRAAVDEAVQEFALGHFQESLSLFERAHAVYPNARTWRGIGMAEFELRHYGRCIVALNTALSSGERPLEGALRADTEELLARANGFVANVSFALRPTTAKLRVDGVPVTLGPEQTVLLTAGEHVLEAEAAGYLSERRQVIVRGGTKETVQSALAAPPPEPPPAKPVAAEPPGPETEAASPKKRSVAKNPWLWTAVGVVVAGSAVGTALALRKGQPEDTIVSGSPEINGGVVQTLWQAP
jgi:hypothetical protein